MKAIYFATVDKYLIVTVAKTAFLAANAFSVEFSFWFLFFISIRENGQTATVFNVNVISFSKSIIDNNAIYRFVI